MTILSVQLLMNIKFKTLQRYHFDWTQRNTPMYNPFSDYINETQNNQTVANLTDISIDQIFLLNTKTTTAPTLSGSPLAPLNIASTYSLKCTNNNPFQTETIINATANPCQKLYQPHTAPNISHSTILPASSSNLYPLNPSPVVTQNDSVPFGSMNKLVKTFDVVDHQYTPEK